MTKMPLGPALLTTLDDSDLIELARLVVVAWYWSAASHGDQPPPDAQALIDGDDTPRLIETVELLKSGIETMSNDTAPDSVLSSGKLSKRSVECQTHGRGPWLGDVVCAEDGGGCGRRWNLEDDSRQPGPEHGRRCTCGAQLVAEDDAAPDAPFTARVVCSGCAAERAAQN